MRRSGTPSSSTQTPAESIRTAARLELLDLFGTHIMDYVTHCVGDEVTRKDAFQLSLTESQQDRRVYDGVREVEWIISTVRWDDYT